MKKVIINADDFGYSYIFNKSILNLIKENLISSTTVMVNYITEKQENQIKELINLKNLHNISIGLHLEFKNNNFDYEIKLQFNKFKKIFGFTPSHLDIHKPNYSLNEKLALINFCNKNNLLCRNLGFNKIIKTTSKKCINGTEIKIENIEKEINNLEDKESYEILFHPGTYDNNCKSSLNKEREEDIKKIKLCNIIFKKLDIKLITYYDLK